MVSIGICESWFESPWLKHLNIPQEPQHKILRDCVMAPQKILWPIKRIQNDVATTGVNATCVNGRCFCRLVTTLVSQGDNCCTALAGTPSMSFMFLELDSLTPMDLIWGKQDQVFPFQSTFETTMGDLQIHFSTNCCSFS